MALDENSPAYKRFIEKFGSPPKDQNAFDSFIAWEKQHEPKPLTENTPASKEPAKINQPTPVTFSQEELDALDAIPGIKNTKPNIQNTPEPPPNFDEEVPTLATKPSKTSAKSTSSQVNVGLMAQLDRALLGKYFITKDKEDPGKLHIVDKNGKQGMTLRLGMVENTNVAGPVVTYGSEAGGGTKALSPKLSVIYDKKDGDVKTRLTDSITKTASYISQAFGISAKNPETTPEAAFNTLVTHEDRILGNKANPSLPVGAYPAGAQKTLSLLQVEFATSTGAAPLPQEQHDMEDTLRTKIFFSNEAIPINPQKDSGVMWKDIRNAGMAWEKKGKGLIPYGERTIDEGTDLNPMVKVALFRKPEKAIKNIKVQYGTSAVANAYQWQDGKVVPVTGKPTTNTQRPNIALSNVLVPGEKTPRTLQRASFLITPIDTAGGAVAYENPYQDPNVAFYGKETTRSAPIGVENLRQLVTGEVKITQKDVLNKVLYAGATHNIGTFAFGEKQENIKLEASPMDYIPQKIALNIPEWWNPETGAPARGPGKGIESTKPLAAEIAKKQGIEVNRGMNLRTTLDVIGVTPTDAVPKDLAIKVGTNPVGIPGSIQIPGVAEPRALSYVLQDIGKGGAQIFTQGFFGGMSYNQNKDFMREWAQKIGTPEAQETADYFEKQYQKRADKDQSLNIQWNKIAARYQKATKGTWQGTGEEFAQQMFSEVIAKETPGSAKDIEHIEKYNAGYAPNVEFSRGYVHPETLQMLSDMGKRAYMAEHPKATEQDVEAFLNKNYRLEGTRPEDMATSLLESVKDNSPEFMQLKQISSGRALYFEGLHQFRAEYAGRGSANPELISGLTSEYPDLARSLGLHVSQFPRQTKSQRGFAAGLSFLAFQTQSITGGMSPATMPTAKSYTEATPEMQEKLRTVLETTTDMDVPDRLKAVREVLGDKQLYYFPGTQTFIPGARPMQDLAYEKLGIEAYGTQHKYLRALENVTAQNIPEMLRASGDAAIDRGQDAVQPLYETFTKLASGTGSVKSFLSRTSGSLFGGRYGRADYLAPNEMELTFAQLRRLSATMGARGNALTRVASQLGELGPDVAVARYPELTDDMIAAEQLVRKSEIRRRIGGRAQESIASDPRFLNQVRMSPAFNIMMRGDEDRDPFVGAVAALYTKGKLRKIEDPRLRENQLTLQQAYAKEAATMPSQELRDKTNAYGSQMADMVNEKDIVGGLFKEAGLHDYQDLFRASESYKQNSTLGMGIGYVPRHALNPWMGASGYTQEEISRAMNLIPNWYQPALDALFKGESSKGHRIAKSVASAYISQNWKGEPILTTSFGDEKEQTKRDYGGSIQPTRANTKATLPLREMYGTKGMDFVRNVAAFANQPVQIGNDQVYPEPEELAPLFALPDAGQEPGTEVNKLTKMLAEAPRENRHTIIGQYLQAGALAGATTMEQYQVGMEKIYSTPLIGSYWANSGRKLIEGFSAIDDKERIKGSIEAMGELAKTSAPFYEKIMGVAQTTSFLRRFKGSQFGGFTSSGLQGMSSAYESGYWHNFSNTLLNRLGVQIPQPKPSPAEKTLFGDNLPADEIIRIAKLTAQAKAGGGGSDKQPPQEPPVTTGGPAPEEPEEPGKKKPDINDPDFVINAQEIPFDEDKKKSPIDLSDVKAWAAKTDSYVAPDPKYKSVEEFMKEAKALGYEALIKTGAEQKGTVGGGFPNRPSRNPDEVVTKGWRATEKVRGSLNPLIESLQRDLGITDRTAKPFWEQFGLLTNTPEERRKTLTKLSPNTTRQLKEITDANHARAAALGVIDRSSFSGWENIKKDLMNPMVAQPMEEIGRLGATLQTSEIGLNPFMLQQGNQLAEGADFTNVYAQAQGLNLLDPTNAYFKQQATALLESPENKALVNRAMRINAKFPGQKADLLDPRIRELGQMGEAVKVMDPALLKESKKVIGPEIAISDKNREKLSGLWQREEKLSSANQLALDPKALSDRLQELGKTLQDAAKSTTVLTDVQKKHLEQVKEEHDILSMSKKERDKALAETRGERSRTQAGVYLGVAKQEEDYWQRETMKGTPGSLQKLIRSQGLVSKLESEQVAREEEEKAGPYGQFARRMLGGFGLMYMRSVWGYISAGMGQGQEQAMGLEQNISSEAARTLGVRQPVYNPQQILQNQQALMGSNANPLLAAQTAITKLPVLGDIGGMLSAGVGSWGMTQYMASTMPGTATGTWLSKAALPIGLGVAAVSGGAQIYQKTQDQESLAYRLSRFGPTAQNYTAPLDSLAQYFLGGYQYKPFTNTPTFEEGSAGDKNKIRERWYEEARKKMAAGATFEELQKLPGSEGQYGTLSGATRLLLETPGMDMFSPQAVAQVEGMYARNQQWKANPVIAKQLAAGFQSNIPDQQVAQQMLAGMGKGPGYAWERNQQGSLNIDELTLALSNRPISEEQKERIKTAAGFMASVPGAKYMEGAPTFIPMKEKETDQNPNKSLTDTINYFDKTIAPLIGTAAEAPLLAAQQAYMSQRALGRNPAAINAKDFSPDMTPEQVAQSLAQSQATNFAATQQMSMAQNQFNRQSFFGSPQLGQQMYGMMTSAPTGAVASMMNRVFNAEPLAMATLATQGVNFSNLPGINMLGGGKIGAEYAAYSDIGLNGQVTGLGWGSTSFRLGDVSGSTMATRLFGKNWQNNSKFSQGGIQAGISGQALSAPITLPNGQQINSIGGTMGMQMYGDQLQYESQMAQIAIQNQQNKLQFAFTTGVGLNQYNNTKDPRTGKPFGNLGATGGFWGIEDKQRALGYEQQEWQFGFQQRQLDLGNRQFQENMALTQRGNTMQRGWARQDWQFQDETRGMQWGWKQEDFQENVRFMTGRERRLAERGMERETIMHDKEGEKIDRDRSRQQELWKLEDERFDLQRKQHQESLAMQEEQLKKSQEFYEERKKLEEDQVKLQRAYFVQTNALAKQSADAAAYYAKEQLNLKNTMNQLQIASELTKGQLSLVTEEGFNKLLEALIKLNPALEAIIEDMLGIDINGAAQTPIGGGGGTTGTTTSDGTWVPPQLQYLLNTPSELSSNSSGSTTSNLLNTNQVVHPNNIPNAVAPATTIVVNVGNDELRRYVVGAVSGAIE